MILHWSPCNVKRSALYHTTHFSVPGCSGVSQCEYTINGVFKKKDTIFTERINSNDFFRCYGCFGINGCRKI